MPRPDELSEELPFTEEEWESIHELGLAIVNATAVDDHALTESLLLQLQDLLSEMRARYDDHPKLIETLADYTFEHSEQVRLYEEAESRAEAIGFATYTILFSWAEALCDEGEHRTALALLERSADQMAALGDDDDQKQHRELLELCRREAR
jgi:hypothetical protein